MNPFVNSFCPYQPSIDYAGEETVSYEEREPDADLRYYVYRYWRLRSVRKRAVPFSYRVVSDGCIDILFEQTEHSFFITGFSRRSVSFDLDPQFDYVGVRFLPAGFPLLFEESAQRLTNNFIPLRDYLPSLASDLLAAFSERMDLRSASSVFDTLLKMKLAEKGTPPEADGRFLDAIHRLLSARGRISTGDMCVDVSERQLRRLFQYYLGASPKTFAQVMRFQNVLGATSTWNDLVEDRVYYDEGYYDQAHFIKEFKSFYGLTPGQAFGKG